MRNTVRCIRISTSKSFCGHKMLSIACIPHPFVAIIMQLYSLMHHACSCNIHAQKMIIKGFVERTKLANCLI